MGKGGYFFSNRAAKLPKKRGGENASSFEKTPSCGNGHENDRISQVFSPLHFLPTLVVVIIFRP